MDKDRTRQAPTTGLGQKPDDKAGFPLFKNVDDPTIGEWSRLVKDSSFVQFLLGYIEEKTREIGVIAVTKNIDMESLRKLQGIVDGILGIKSLLETIPIEHQRRTERKSATANSGQTDK